jgi:hypothetical protein
MATIRVVTTPANEWIDEFAARLGVAAPGESEREAILALAGTAAHASERTAAPIACWIAAAAGLSVEDALAHAREVVPPATA